MNKIVIDLEFTKINRKYKEERKICGFETIQIGAVKLDEKNEVVDKFTSFVKPMYSEIQPMVTHLTGITDEMVSDALEFTFTIEEFLDWVGEEDVIVYSWSETDKYQILKECNLKNCKTERVDMLLDNWVDLQALVGSLLGIRQALSLETALKGTGLEFEGQEHSAMDDAANTAELFRLTEDEERFKKSAGAVLDIMKETAELTYSMGDLFKNIKIA